MLISKYAFSNADYAPEIIQFGMLQVSTKYINLSRKKRKGNAGVLKQSQKNCLHNIDKTLFEQ
jgi:hypothetical protein